MDGVGRCRSDMAQVVLWAKFCGVEIVYAVKPRRIRKDLTQVLISIIPRYPSALGAKSHDIVRKSHPQIRKIRDNCFAVKTLTRKSWGLNRGLPNRNGG